MFFKINSKLAIGAEVYRTRRSWGHKAHLYRVRTPELNDEHVESAKIVYLNRTWERFEFEDVLCKVVTVALKNRNITKEEAGICNTYIKNYQEPDRFAGVAMVAKLGDFLGKNQKESNDWKTRMLKAGLENRGLIMPDDWDSLDEATKEARLNGAIAQLA